MRGIVIPPGSRAHHTQTDRVGTWDISCLAVLALAGGPHREDEEL
jgi:hypothetical protein